MAKSYRVDHLQQSNVNNEQLEFIVELCEDHDDLVSAKFQSNHLNHRKHMPTVQFNEKNEQAIIAWYCKVRTMQN